MCQPSLMEWFCYVLTILFVLFAHLVKKHLSDDWIFKHCCDAHVLQILLSQVAISGKQDLCNGLIMNVL